jgi:FKBP-type peptidyl-prolyl cis-trans isomerase
MKQTIFTLLLLSAIGLSSCRKLGEQPGIKQYDQDQIQSYISANGITGMQKDTAGGDTTGMYYKIILPPKTDTALTYSDNISFVFTLRSFDGHYISTDTIRNHYQGYVGHIVGDALPVGLELAILNDLKYVGSSMRVLIPSHLAYGVNGYGTGSITNTSSRIAGNQCLDYYVHVIASQPDNAQRQAAYDYQVIKNYIAANNLTGYTLDSGVYYHIQTQGTGTDHITDNSTVEVTYNGRLYDNAEFDASSITDTTALNIPDLVTGVSRTLKNHAVQGTVISMLIPSYLGYGTQAQTGLPANSCLRFEFTIHSVSP